MVAIIRQDNARGLFRALIHDHYNPRFLWLMKTNCIIVVKKATLTLKLNGESVAVTAVTCNTLFNSLELIRVVTHGFA